MAYSPFTLPQASPFASQVDGLFFLLLGLSGLLVIGVFLLIIVFCIQYRYHLKAKPRGNVPEKLQLRWEIGWTLIPLLVYLGLFFWGAWLYLALSAPPEGALEIHGIGKQWMWKFQHPEGQREIDELHLPRGQPVRMILTTEDVIHSFYVPAFRVKQDLVPGRYTSLWFTPTETGEYRLFCAEFCGTSHSQMRGRIVVMEPEDYQDWLRLQGSPISLTAEGEKLFRAYGCSGCHSPQSTVHAPKLEGVYGRAVHLRDGSTVVVDESYLRDSILLPQKQVVAGFEPIMPSFEGQISEADILKIIAYIKSLSTEATDEQP